MATRVEKPHVVVVNENEDVSDDSVSIEEEDEEALSNQEASDVEKSDGEEQNDDDDDDDDKEDNDNPNAGWAEAMAKILDKKTPESKPSILLKNKELDKIKEKEKKERLEKKQKIDKKRAWENMCREKPDVVRDRDQERTLQRIATRGVVQLFNAVKKHQKNMDEKVKDAGGSVRKKAKIISSVSKKDFIDVLRAADGAHNPAVKKETDTAVEVKAGKPSWSVLRDDFMMGASMKDWDKESDEERGAADQEPAEDYSSESE